MEYNERKTLIIEMINNANALFDEKGKNEFIEFMEEQGIELRICSVCKKIMYEGYCIEGGTEYYCSDKCKDKEMTKEEFDKLFDGGEGDSYWTEWI